MIILSRLITLKQLDLKPPMIDYIMNPSNPKWSIHIITTPRSKCSSRRSGLETLGGEEKRGRGREREQEGGRDGARFLQGKV